MSPMTTEIQEKSFTWLALFASTGTLICCALPIVFVSLSLGATVAAISSSVPFLVALSLHKGWVFLVSAMLLASSGWLLFRAGRACPADPQLAVLCDRALLWNRQIFRAAVAIWSVGFFAAYLALPLRIWLTGA